MINTSDIAFCRALITRIGEPLLDISKRGAHLTSWEDMRRRFLEANT